MSDSTAPKPNSEETPASAAPEGQGFFEQGKHWPWIIGGILATTVTVNMVVLSIASGDPSFVIQENYYDDATRWDEHRAEVAASRKLGWKTEAKAEAYRDGGKGKVALSLELKDKAGAPLTGAQITVSGFAVVNSSKIEVAMLEEKAPGHYVGDFDHGRPGLWEFDVTARRAGDNFISKERVEATLR